MAEKGFITRIKNFAPSWMSINRPVEEANSPTRLDDALRPDRYVMPFQMQRLRQDASTWRDAVTEAENAWWMHRVKMQQLFIDTILNGHVVACMNKRKDAVLLKKFVLSNGDTVDEKATKLLEANWFFNLLNYILDAKFFGYSLIGLGDLVNNEFPDLKLVRRWNVSPDRLNITSIVYSLNGINFTDPSVKDTAGNSFYDWSIWVETPTEAGPSRCGYGLLYKVAIYEIYLRNLLGFNADFCEMFGIPYRHLKTDAKGEEKAKQEASMADMGHSGYLLTPPDVELEIFNEGSVGAGYKSYDNFEARLEKKISKIILGHEDAISGTPGKLGSQQGKDNPAEKALLANETIDCRFVEHIMNSQVIPKLINLGFPIPMGLKFKFKNDSEINEIRESENKTFADTATFVKTLADAGLTVDPKWITERTGIPLEKKEVAPPPNPLNNNPAVIDKGLQKAIKNFYAKAKV